MGDERARLGGFTETQSAVELGKCIEVYESIAVQASPSYHCQAQAYLTGCVKMWMKRSRVLRQHSMKDSKGSQRDVNLGSSGRFAKREICRYRIPLISGLLPIAYLNQTGPRSAPYTDG